MSVAVRMIGKAPARKPPPPMVPSGARTLLAGSGTNDEKLGTSPLAPGVSCVETRPAGPLSVIVALLLPSKPMPVTS